MMKNPILQAVGDTFSGKLGIVKILKLDHISKNPS
jgi:hypothetical protein